MTDIAFLALKQRVTRLTAREQENLSACLIRLGQKRAAKKKRTSVRSAKNAHPSKARQPR